MHGDFFVLGDGTRTLLRVDPQTGEAKWSARLPGRDKYEASPLVADGKVYVVDFGGHTSVYDMANGNQLASMQMVEKQSRHVIRSSIIAAQGQLFIRRLVLGPVDHADDVARGLARAADAHREQRGGREHLQGRAPREIGVRRRRRDVGAHRNPGVLSGPGFVFFRRRHRARCS